MTLIEEIKHNYRTSHWLTKSYWIGYPLWCIVVFTLVHHKIVTDKQSNLLIIGFFLWLMSCYLFLWCKAEGFFQGWTLIHHHLTNSTFKSYGPKKEQREREANNGLSFTEWYRQQNKIANPNYVEPDYEKDLLDFL